MNWTSLPDTASEGERAGLAAFFMLSMIVPMMRAGHTPTAATFDKIIAGTSNLVASGSSPAALAMRERLDELQRTSPTQTGQG